jgi:hypothetical protein
MNAPTYGTAVDYAHPPTAATPPLPVQSYTGSFRNDFYGDLIIAAENDRLDLRIGPALTSYPLTHYDRDVFTYQPPGENAFGPSAVTFLVGPEGNADRVTLENLDLDGQGTFQRAHEH